MLLDGAGGNEAEVAAEVGGLAFDDGARTVDGFVGAARERVGQRGARQPLQRRRRLRREGVAIRRQRVERVAPGATAG